jgi:hypothetical protein
MPFDLAISTTAAGDVVITEPVGRALAGTLTLPYVSGGKLDFADLYVPSSGRFTQADLDRLWDVGYEYGQWKRSRAAIAGRETGYGSPEVVGRAEFVRDWRAIGTCAMDANALLSAWPTTLGRREAWLPIGTPGGVEDVLQTERTAERRQYILDRAGSLVVTHSVRRFGDRNRRRSRAVSSLAQSVLQLLSQSLPADELRQIRVLAAPIASVVSEAATPGGTADPELSSWPQAFAMFSGSCMKAIAELQASRRGRGVVPLLDTDELYEAWLILEIVRILEGMLRDGNQIESDALFARRLGPIIWELWAKPALTASGIPLGAETFVSIVAEPLLPDLVLTASTAGFTEAFVWDAKAWAVLSPDNALEKSAKYLYGIRKPSMVHVVPTIAGVDLVTCAEAPTLVRQEIGRVRVINATPTANTDALEASVGDVVRELAERVTARGS